MKCNFVTVIAVALASLCGAGTAGAQGIFTLTSTAFQDGGQIPTKYGGNNPAVPSCVGENISPALSWSNPPDGARSFALIVFDIDGRLPVGFVHWVAYGIAPSVTGFVEGEVSQQTDKYVGGKASTNLASYAGPCPSAGPPHHYIFSLWATDLEPTALQAGLTRDELIKALDGHIKGGTSLVGTYSKPTYSKP